MKAYSNLKPAMAMIWLAVFAGCVALLGGSSRPDAIQIVVLRPLCALFLIPALYYLRAAAVNEAKALLLLLVLLAAWIALQLLPLPASIWSALPERGALQELGRHFGMENAWRPISLVPSRGWNALASMVVPASALLLGLALAVKSRHLLMFLAGIGSINAALGLMQFVSGRSSPLYLYEITNRGSPVGLFANENHSAVFSSIALLLIARLAASSGSHGEPTWLRLIGAPVYVIVLLSVLVSGSRSGLATTGLAIMASGVIVWITLENTRKSKDVGAIERWVMAHPQALLAVFAVVLVALISAFFNLGRTPGFSDILNESAFEDMRWKIWPVLEQMIGQFWVLGAGFGSFEEVYHIFEPTGLLYQKYVNQAHNDWAQLIIEGGGVAIVLLLSLLAWVANSLKILYRRGGNALSSLVFWGSTVVILCTSSLVDYPMRTPIFMFSVSWLLLSLAMERSEKSSNRRSARQ